MAIKRRWLQSALEESRRPQPKMPWQARKLAAVLSKFSNPTKGQSTASA